MQNNYNIKPVLSAVSGNKIKGLFIVTVKHKNEIRNYGATDLCLNANHTAIRLDDVKK